MSNFLGHSNSPGTNVSQVAEALCEIARGRSVPQMPSLVATQPSRTPRWTEPSPDLTSHQGSDGFVARRERAISSFTASDDILIAVGLNPQESHKPILSRTRHIVHLNYAIKTSKTTKCGECNSKCRTEMYKCIQTGCVQQICRECVLERHADRHNRAFRWLGAQHSPFHGLWMRREQCVEQGIAFSGTMTWSQEIKHAHTENLVATLHPAEGEALIPRKLVAQAGHDSGITNESPFPRARHRKRKISESEDQPRVNISKKIMTKKSFAKVESWAQKSRENEDDLVCRFTRATAITPPIESPRQLRSPFRPSSFSEPSPDARATLGLGCGLAQRTLLSTTSSSSTSPLQIPYLDSSSGTPTQTSRLCSILKTPCQASQTVAVYIPTTGAASPISRESANEPVRRTAVPGVRDRQDCAENAPSHGAPGTRFTPSLSLGDEQDVRAVLVSQGGNVPSLDIDRVGANPVPATSSLVHGLMKDVASSHSSQPRVNEFLASKEPRLALAVHAFASGHVHSKGALVYRRRLVPSFQPNIDTALANRQYTRRRTVAVLADEEPHVDNHSDSY